MSRCILEFGPSSRLQQNLNWQGLKERKAKRSRSCGLWVGYIERGGGEILIGLPSTVKAEKDNTSEAPPAKWRVTS